MINSCLVYQDMEACIVMVCWYQNLYGEVRCEKVLSTIDYRRRWNTFTFTFPICSWALHVSQTDLNSWLQARTSKCILRVEQKNVVTCFLYCIVTIFHFTHTFVYSYNNKNIENREVCLESSKCVSGNTHIAKTLV